jgi:pimeloyl-ACP methyl ester carboxylesterase
MRRHAFPIAIMFALLLAAAGAPASLGSTATQPEPGSGIAWRPCATPELPTQECGQIDVPLDYDEPDGPTISLAVARVPATDQTQRIGSLFLNPGGPGGPGVFALPIQYGPLPEGLRERFDVVGFDPRGVGESAPVRCFASTTELATFTTAYLTEQVAPAGPAGETAMLAAYEDVARRCGELNAEILPHVSTANVARDLDRLRQAVGDEQLNYFGTSYGTYLGATYANLFPDRIRAMALDGVINPASYTSFDQGDGDVVGPDTTSFLRILSDQGSAEALAAFFAECTAAGVSRCAFAAPTNEETGAKFDALMERLRTDPAVAVGVAGTLTVTYSLVVWAVWNALYAAPAWAGIAQGLQHLHDGDAAGFLTAMKLLGGPLPAQYMNTNEAQWAINCVDTDNASAPVRYLAMAQSAEERSPYFGALWTYQGLPCAFWPAQDEDRYAGPWDAETSATILLISRVLDPATPHSGAIAAEQTLANARLLTIDGWGHGYFVAGRSTCADAATAAYFVDGQLPAEGTVCAEDTPPFGR